MSQGSNGYLWLVAVVLGRTDELINSADDNDPLKYLYDIDDGKLTLKSTLAEAHFRTPASTVITLADWYHGLSTVLFPNPNKEAP